MTAEHRSADLGRGLRWVRSELEQSLERVRNLLAGVLDDDQPVTSLAAGVQALREVGNVCGVARCAGAQLLIWQMLRSLEQTIAETEQRDERLAELVAASYQLSKYIGIVADGVPDHPLAALDSINGLRTVCGEKTLGGAALLAQSWRLGQVLQLPPRSPERSAQMLGKLAAKHHAVLREATQRVVADRRHGKAWQLLGQAAGQFARVAPSAGEWSLWQLFRGVAVVGPRLPDAAGPRVLDLLQHLVAWVGRVGQMTPAQREATATTLLAGWALLIVQLDRKGSLASSLLEPLGLNREALVAQRLKLIDEAMMRPAEDSLVAVVRALQQDLVALREEVEVLQGNADRASDDVDAAVSRFKRLSSTFSGLGQDRLAETLRSLGKQLDALADMPPDAAGWPPLAEGMIRVEEEVSAVIMGRRTGSQASPMAAEARASIVRECLVNLVRVKTEVEALIQTQKPENVRHVSAQLRELTGALQIFGDARLITPLVRLRELMGQAGFAPALAQPPVAAAVADAIASSEYLLEALRDSDPDVGAEAERLNDFVAAVAAALEAAADGSGAQVTTVVEPAPPVESEEIDDDLREIFLEEAGEVLATLQAHLEPWQAGEDSSLAEMRRAFHTLKGSGRMVGARDIGDFGLAFESLLNRCRDGDLERSPELLAVVAEGVQALPDIIARFAAGESAREQVEPLCRRANTLMGVSDASADEDLRQTFLQDAASNLAQLRASVLSAPPQAEQVHAWHSLRGSAAAIHADAIAQLAAAAEHLCQQGALVGQPIPAALHTQAVDAVDACLEQLRNDPDTASPTDEALVQALRQAGDALLQGVSTEDDDPELRLIFCAEAQDLLESAETLMNALRAGTGDAQAMQELGRVFHTLKGSAKMAGAQGLGGLGAQLDAQAKQVLANGGLPSADLLRVFGAGVQSAWTLVDAFQSGQDRPAPDLLELVEGDVEATAMPAASTAPDQPAPEPDRETEAAAPAAEPAQAGPATPQPGLPAEDVDLELLEIFLPECDELLDDIDGALRHFDRSKPGESLSVLFRALHTLKGGARMAGLMRLGEHAHELETQVERLRVSGRSVEAAEESALQQAADVLRSMREAVSLTPAAAATETTDEVDAADPDTAVRSADTTTRVQVSRLDDMLSEVGEISMFRSRLEQQMVGLAGQLREFDQTIERLRSQVRNLESATDAQIQARAAGQRHAEDGSDRYETDFDPLEMDRYTRMQELTRSITETISDLGSLHRGMREAVGESEAMVLQQGRLSTSMQEGLLTTLAIPFERQLSRLARVVRQTATDAGKQAILDIAGGETELDRNVLERIVPALEHVLRNAVVHGIETPEQRAAKNKAPEGVVRIALRRDSNRIVLEVEDDGAGLDSARIRAEAVRRGLLAEDAQIGDDRIAQFIFEPGFSTAQNLSLAAGRGVGMDAVAAEVRQLGGSIEVSSQPGSGARVTIRLPFSLAITQAIQVQAGDEDYLVPLATISGVARVPAADVLAAMQSDTGLEYAGVSYETQVLASILGTGEAPGEQGYVPVLFVRSGGDSGSGRNFAVVVDHLLGTREVVAKNVGRAIATVPGVGGASIQPDGRVVVLLDLADLIFDRERRGLRGEAATKLQTATQAPLVLVIDDSITMRRVAERVLTRAGYRVALAKDGADGVAQLQTHRPDAVLLDIEMPRMDGFEVAGFMRHDANLRAVPIVMITSRSGEKHRQRAAAIGVNGYLVKPYQEQQLLDELQRQLREPQVLSAEA